MIVSSDKNGMVEYWTGPKSDYVFPRNVGFESKMDTDLYEFAKVIEYFKFSFFIMKTFFNFL